jgi:hypothetical protein
VSARYYRAQILLEPEQHKCLKEIAKREERSISDVAREMIDRGLRVREEDKQSRLQRSRKALEQLDKIRLQVLEEYGVYDGDLIAEVRSEREKALDETRRGESK